MHTKLTVSIHQIGDYWKAAVYHEDGSLLDETEASTSYGEVCAEVGDITNTEITRQLENEEIDRERAFINSRGFANL